MPVARITTGAVRSAVTGFVAERTPGTPVELQGDVPVWLRALSGLRLAGAAGIGGVCRRSAENVHRHPCGRFTRFEHRLGEIGSGCVINKSA